MSQPILSIYVHLCSPVSYAIKKKKTQKSKSQPFAVDNRNQSEPIKAKVKTKQQRLEKRAEDQEEVSKWKRLWRVKPSVKLLSPPSGIGSDYTNIIRVKSHVQHVHNAVATCDPGMGKSPLATLKTISVVITLNSKV